MPVSDEEIVAAVKEAEVLVNRALPLGAVDVGAPRAERTELRARAFTEVLRVLLGNAQPG